MFLEDQTGVEAGCISTGPERNQTVRRVGEARQYVADLLNVGRSTLYRMMR